MDHPTTELKYRADIDGIRALAILGVVGYHAFPKLVHGGFIGVDVFFVISGFLISAIIFRDLRANRFSVVDFYARRIRRIFPSLLLVLTACLIFGWFSLLAIEFLQLGKYVAGGVAFVSNFILAGEVGYFDRSADLKPLLHLWSLAIEEQFYIVWPALLLLCSRFRWKFAVVGTVLLVLSMLASVTNHAANPSTAFYSPIDRAWEILAGALLALWAPKIDGEQTPRPVVQNIASIAGIIFICGGSFILKSASSYVVAGLLPVVGAVLLISAGPKALANKYILSWRPLVWIGIISYPLYLWHWPLLSFARMVLGEDAGGLLRGLLVVAAFGLAWATFEFVEKPIRSGGRLRFKAAMLSGFGVAVLLVAIGIDVAGGVPSRPYNVVNAGIESALAYDWRRNFRDGTCFLNDDTVDRATFARECRAAGSHRPLVVLWGDSHAASLYQGLLENSTRYGFALAQFTASGCPPILDMVIANRPGCLMVNRAAIQAIKEMKPDIVIMAGYWSSYDPTVVVSDAFRWEALDIRGLQATILKLKSYGIRNITLVGQLPTFDVEQPGLLRRSLLTDRVDDRTYRHFSGSAHVFNDRIRAVATSTAINFVDPLKVLCSNLGCLISLSTQRPVPLAFDYGHLDTEGSDYFIGRVFEQKLITLPAKRAE